MYILYIYIYTYMYITKYIEPNPFNPEGASNKLVRNVCVNYINIHCQHPKCYNLKALITPR